METGRTESADVDKAECKRKSLSLHSADCGESGVLDDTGVVKPSKNVPLKTDCKEENHRQSKHRTICEESGKERISQENPNVENGYVLDATKEGNVGRFLNVSKKLCSLSCLSLNKKHRKLLYKPHGCRRHTTRQGMCCFLHSK